ncbi:MAG: macro domain-containing protein [Candidatus Aenigmatarchaeota archaeon]
MKNISLEIKRGNIAYQNVDSSINSSNGYCIHGSGTAKQFREVCGYLPVGDTSYQSLVDKAKHPLDKVLAYVNNVRPRPSVFQKECLEHIIDVRDSKPLELGDALVTSSGDLAKVPKKAKYIINAIGMDYSWEKEPPAVIKATHNSVRDSLIKCFDIANRKKCKSVAMPIMCTSKGGMSLEESLYASNEALQALDMTTSYVTKVVIVLHSKELLKEEKVIRDFFKL